MGFYSYGYYYPGLNQPSAPCGPWANSVWAPTIWAPTIWAGKTGAPLALTLVAAVGLRAAADPVLGPLLPLGAASVIVGTIGPRQSLPFVSLAEIGSASSRSTSPITYIQDRMLQVSFVGTSVAQVQGFLNPWEACFRPQMAPLQFAGGTLLGMYCTGDMLVDSDVLGSNGTPIGGAPRIYQLLCTFQAKIQRNLPS